VKQSPQRRRGEALFWLIGGALLLAYALSQLWLYVVDDGEPLFPF
jgi:hypothetical protein